MDFSTVVLKVMAGYFIISGLMLVLRGKTFVVVLKDFFKHPAIAYLAGVVLIFLGLIVVTTHFVWDGSLNTLVSVFGVLALAKGIMYIFIPDVMAKFPFAKMGHWLKLIGLVMIAIGGYLWYIS